MYIEQISVYTGDICLEDVDVIAHSVREDLRLLGDVATVISDTAGPSLQQQCTKHIAKHGNIAVSRIHGINHIHLSEIGYEVYMMTLFRKIFVFSLESC